MRRRPSRQASSSVVSLPAPMGGLNTVAPAGQLPAGDALVQTNLVPAERGLRVRLGYREHVTGLPSAVRTLIGFAGSLSSGGNDQLFALTQEGIWNASEARDVGEDPPIVEWPAPLNKAGYAIWTTMTTPAGRFLVVCDEENGLYVYAEETSTWARVLLGVTQAWAANTFYAIGNSVVNAGKIYTCTHAGFSATSGAGPTSSLVDITDGSVTWTYSGAAAAGVIGPSLADQQAGFTGNPAAFVFATVWKSRLWFVERDSSRAWYLPVNSVYGTATSFDFGVKMRTGGALVGLWDWSYDGGSGLDTLLVGISAAGDVVIYQGTDPSSASTFSNKGSWSVGSVPAGRRIATENGGELLVVSSLGLLPVSKLVMGNNLTADRTQYETGKISNRFSARARDFGTRWGWALHIHPGDNALIALLPTEAKEQLVMSFATRGWSSYSGLDMASASAFEGTLYFGTSTGAVMRHDNYVDGVSLSDPNAFTPITWSLVTGFSTDGRVTQIHDIRPSVDGGSSSVSAEARYDYDVSAATAPDDASAGLFGSLWDVARWDVDVFGGDSGNVIQPMRGTSGVGRAAAIAISGKATGPTVLLGYDVIAEKGGVL